MEAESKQADPSEISAPNTAGADETPEGAALGALAYVLDRIAAYPLRMEGLEPSAARRTLTRGWGSAPPGSGGRSRS